MAGRPKILIVGAGPCGLTAALELTRRGFAARIVAKVPGPSPLSKAAGVSPRSLDILEACGVTERLLARGVRIGGAQARYEGRLLARLDISRVPHRFNFLLALPQHETESAMVEVLAGQGVSVEWNVELTAIRLAGAKVEVELSGAAGGTYDYVFAADGAHSRVREVMGLGFSGYTHKRSWSIADVELPDWPFPEATAMVTLRRTGDIGFILPIGPKRFRAISNTTDPLGHVPGAEGAKVSHRDTFHIHVRQADRYQAGGVFLGGDAAHVHSPIGARGMNLGIEDAQAFALRVADDRLDGYTTERHPIGHHWIVISERVLGALQARSPLAIPFRNLAIRAIGRLPALQLTMLQRVAGLRE